MWARCSGRVRPHSARRAFSNRGNTWMGRSSPRSSSDRVVPRRSLPNRVGRLGVGRLDGPGEQGPVRVPTGRRLGVVAVGPGDDGHVELAAADGQGGGVDQGLGVVAPGGGDQDLRGLDAQLLGQERTGVDVVPAQRVGHPQATRPGPAGSDRPGRPPPAGAPSQSSTAAWTASSIRPRGSGRSARLPSPSVRGRLVTCPTPTTTGVAGSIVMARRAYRRPGRPRFWGDSGLRPPIPPAPIGTLGPCGSPWARTTRAMP